VYCECSQRRCERGKHRCWHTSASESGVHDFSLVLDEVLGDGYGAPERTVRDQLHLGVKMRTQRCGPPPRTLRGGAPRSEAQREGRIAPVSTRSPDDAGLAPARCRVTVKLGYSGGGTPAHSVTFLASLKVPTGTRTPVLLFSHAS